MRRVEGFSSIEPTPHTRRVKSFTEKGVCPTEKQMGSQVLGIESVLLPLQYGVNTLSNYVKNALLGCEPPVLFGSEPYYSEVFFCLYSLGIH